MWRALERYRDDGLMVLFNDPFPCVDPADRAIGLAVALRKRMEQICLAWHGMGRKLSFRVAIAHRYATLGSVGSENRFDYTTVGPVISQAARQGMSEILPARDKQTNLVALPSRHLLDWCYSRFRSVLL
jgi:class 3 adenylate cyclase